MTFLWALSPRAHSATHRQLKLHVAPLTYVSEDMKSDKVDSDGSEQTGTGF